MADPSARALRGVLAPLRYGPGEIPGLVCATVGLLAGLRRRGRRREAAVLAAATAAFLGPLLVAWHPHYRYALPALPFLAAFAAAGVTCAQRSSPPRLRTALGVAAVVGLCAPAFWRSLRVDLLLSRSDTRTLAGEWIRAHVPSGVPIVILGGPECEPQVAESAASIERRIAYVKRLYGPAAGSRVALPYRFQQQARPDLGYEVFRNEPGPEAPRVCVVVASYPLPNPACPSQPSRKGFESVSGRVVASADFESVAPDSTATGIDAMDAFFLPMDDLGRVTRPGPHLHVVLVDCSSGGRP